MITIGDIERVLTHHYPPRSAESWDRVGLVTGDIDRPVERILLTVDVTDAVIAEGARAGADLIIAHHPLLLRGITSVDPRQPKGRMITALVRHGIGLITAHTNADIPAGGVADSLADALGLTDTRPLRPVPVDPADKLTCYVPADHVDAVIDALASAGAGAVGAYDRCAFTAPGTGTFRPLSGAEPYLGTVGSAEQVAEHRVEMIMDRSRRSAVVAALLAAHPYEQPAYDVVETAAPADTGPAAGLGRIGTVPATTLADFARHVTEVLPATPAGVRVAGDRDRPVHTVALQAGAGDDLLDAARAAGADAYLTSDLRHHPAAEAVAWPSAPALIDVPHWAAEWTWLPRLREELTDRCTETLTVTVSTIRTDPWDFVVGR